jgi:peptidoglycan/LPS O-acetylase OafA/YrhL
MYLWHVVIGIQAIGIVKKITGTASSSQSLSSNEYILACIIAVIIIFLFAVIIYILIEYPFLKIKEYILKKYKKESLPGINN